MPQPTLSPSRILVVGASGSGKTTLAERLSKRTFAPVIKTDGLYWDRKWKTRSDAEVMSSIDFNRERWIIDGNFDSSWKKVWPKADLVIWLNLPIYLVFWRVMQRNLRWALTQAPWNGERMPPGVAVQGVVHSLRSYFRKKTLYPERIRHLGKASFVECNSDADVEDLLKML